MHKIHRLYSFICSDHDIGGSGVATGKGRRTASRLLLLLASIGVSGCDITQQVSDSFPRMIEELPLGAAEERFPDRDRKMDGLLIRGMRWSAEVEDMAA